MRKQNTLIILILALLCILLALISIAVRLGTEHKPAPETTGSTSSSDTTGQTDSQGTSEPAGSTGPTDSTDSTENTTATENTDPTESTQQTVPTEPQPTQAPEGDYIGTLYTRQELEAMENEEKGYGPGKTSGGARAPYAVGDQKKYGQYAANFIAPDNGKIYLTFDCGYEYIATDANGQKYRVTAKILDTLKEKNVKAVFFVTMYYVKEHPDLVQRMIDEGHVVGNHSNNHKSMPTLSIDDMVYEINSLHDYVLDHFGYKMTLFRPPTGTYSTRSLAVVQSLGYKTVHWSFAYLDYDTEKQPEIDAAFKRVTESHHSGAIYLLHAISTTNAAILADSIDFFRAEGYTLDLFQ